MLSFDTVETPRPAPEAQPVPEGQDGFARRVAALVEELKEIARSGRAEQAPCGELSALMLALVEIYGARFDRGCRDMPIAPDPAIRATSVLVTTSALLKAANVEIFELGMWQSWSGTR